MMLPKIVSHVRCTTPSRLCNLWRPNEVSSGLNKTSFEFGGIARLHEARSKLEDPLFVFFARIPNILHWELIKHQTVDGATS